MLFLLLVPVLVSGVQGQDRAGNIFRHELRAGSLNDNFLPPIQDHYFTNGLQISYHRLLDGSFLQGGLLPEHSSKTILRFRLSHEIYTPFSILQSNVNRLDRPYAGYLSVKSSLDNFWNKNNRLNIALNLGVIGPKSGGKWLQTQWHEWFGFPQPEGWQYQIGHVPVVNLDIGYQRAWEISSAMEIISNARIRAGTAFNNVSVGGTFRIGNIHSIDRSAFTGSRLGTGNTPGNRSVRGETEWFLFLGIDNRVVLHNALIEGGFLFSTSDIHTEKAEPYVATLKTGLSFSMPAVSWTLTMNQLTPEVAGARSHNYVSIEMAYRF